MSDNEPTIPKSPATARLMRGICDVCKQPIMVKTDGVPPTVTDDEWFAALEQWQRDYLHTRHVEDDTPIIGSRAVTKPVRAKSEGK